MSEFCYYGDVAALAAEQGLRVKGNTSGGSINDHYFGFGAITSVVVSDLLRTRLQSPKAMPIPVGFDNISAPKCKGAIAKQFPDAIPEGYSDEQADSHVVKAYFELAEKEQKVGDDFKTWNIPPISAKTIIKRTKRHIDIDWSLIPEKFYILVQGDDDDLELVRDICEDDGVPFHTESNGVHITNVDRGYFPPLASQLFEYDFGKSSSRVLVDGSNSSRKVSDTKKTSRQASSTALPEAWHVMKSVPSIAAYEQLIVSHEFKDAVSANKRRMGSNKNKITTQLLSKWDYDDTKSVGEFLELCAEFYRDDEEMQAKLFLAIVSHLRVDGDKLYRTKL